MKARIAAVIALTLASITATASADEPAPAPPPPAPVVEPHAEATPLATRPSKPLTLASPNEGTPLGYKLLAGVGVAAAAGLWLRKRRGAKATVATTRIDILGRRSIGVRSELLVVEVEGTRLLVGMTPGGVQSLAVLDGTSEVASEPADEAALPEDAVEAPRPMLQVADRARALLGDLRVESKPAAAPAPRRPAQPRTSKLSRVEGQAKGLLLALEPAAAPAAEAAPRKTRRTARSVDG